MGIKDDLYDLLLKTNETNLTLEEIFAHPAIIALGRDPIENYRILDLINLARLEMADLEEDVEMLIGEMEGDDD